MRDTLGEKHDVVASLAFAATATDSPDTLARQLAALARGIKGLLGAGGPLADELRGAGYDDEHAAHLDALAARVRKTHLIEPSTESELDVDQRKLDLQDGRVLHLVELIWRSFRRARARNPAVVVPSPGDLESVCERRSATEEEPAPPAPAPAPAPVPTPA